MFEKRVSELGKAWAKDGSHQLHEVDGQLGIWFVSQAFDWDSMKPLNYKVGLLVDDDIVRGDWENCFSNRVFGLQEELRYLAQYA
jgi:hypothetical protein